MTVKPKRIQLRRTKGWKLPPNTVKVDRSTKWGNQFQVGSTFQSVDDDGNVLGEYVCASTRQAVELYRNYLESDFGDDLYWDAKEQLRGKNLACWCKPGDPCHADVLLEIANESATERKV